MSTSIGLTNLRSASATSAARTTRGSSLLGFSALTSLDTILSESGGVPSLQEGPQSSPQLLRADDADVAGQRSRLEAWDVCALAFLPAEALDLLLALPRLGRRAWRAGTRCATYFPRIK